MAQGYKAQPKDGYEKLVKEIDRLNRRVDALTTAASNRNASISDGGDLTILDTSGNQVVKAGHDSAGARGFSLTSENGVDMLDFGIATATPGRPVLDLNDSTGALAFGTDPAVNGTGIFWPFMAAVMGNMTITQWPFNTSASFVTVSQGSSYRFSQGIIVAARIVCDSGATAGQARLLVDGSQVGSTVAVTTSVGDANLFGLTGGIIRSAAFIEVQTRVTAGAGNCRAQVYEAYWAPNAYVT